MAVTDVWADWTTTAASNAPAGTATPEIDDEIRNIKAQCKTNLMAMADVQTVTGAKTFNTGKLVVQSTTAGYLQNSTAGVVTYGNSIAAADLSTGIDAAKIANGTVSNTEFQYLGGVTSDIQTQLNTIVPAASQAEQEAGSEAAKYVAPAKQQFHPSAAKFWCIITGSDGSLYSGYNVTSTARASEGNFTVTIATDFSAYGIVFATAQSSVSLFAIITGNIAGTISIGVRNVNANAYDPIYLHVVGFGDQA